MLFAARPKTGPTRNSRVAAFGAVMRIAGHNPGRKVDIMKKEIRVHNGENMDITVVTDYCNVTILAKSSAIVEVDEDAEFNSGEFYVEEDGDWYAKADNCYTGADIEIYKA